MSAFCSCGHIHEQRIEKEPHVSHRPYRRLIRRECYEQGCSCLNYQPIPDVVISTMHDRPAGDWWRNKLEPQDLGLTEERMKEIVRKVYERIKEGPPEPQRLLCMRCKLPIEVGDMVTCEICTKAGIETAFCWRCSHYHQGNHAQQERSKPRGDVRET